MTLYYSLLFLVIILVEMKPQFQTKSNISNLNSSYYFSHWCGKGLEILEDASCKKIFPSSFSRNFSCPIYSFENYNLPSNGYYSEDIGLENIQIDSTTLSSIINVSINLCMILTKRVRSIESATGKVTTKLFNKYFCYQNSSTFASETWSSSKIFAMANAAGHLRTNASSCVPDSLGLDAATTGKHNVTQLGDLSTIITSYDSTAGYSSNGLSSYFHDLGERSRLFNLVNSAWLGLPYPVSLGGNYGEATPADLSFDLFTGCNTESSDTCAVAKDTTGEYENTLSSLAHAELLRRIVLHREVNPSLRFPNVTWADIQVCIKKIYYFIYFFNIFIPFLLYQILTEFIGNIIWI